MFCCHLDSSTCSKCVNMRRQCAGLGAQQLYSHAAGTKGLGCLPALPGMISLHSGRKSLRLGWISVKTCPGSQSDTLSVPTSHHRPLVQHAASATFREEAGSADGRPVATGCSRCLCHCRAAPRPSVYLSLHHIYLESTRTRQATTALLQATSGVLAVDVVLWQHHL